MDEEAIKLINERLDIIEDKLARIEVRLDPYNLNEFFRTRKNRMPDGYTLVGTGNTRTD